VEIRTDGWLAGAGCSSVLPMKLTDHRIISGVAVAIPALAMIGFGLGVLQGQRPPTEPQPLPIPTSMGSHLNLQAVPSAAPIDPAAANAAIDPLAARIRARKAEAAADNATDDGPDDGAPEAAEAPTPSPPQPNAVHGPF
jgi:hypothetical protein